MRSRDKDKMKLTSNKNSNHQEINLPEKVLVVGLDGATWWLLERLMQDGAMPALTKLIENGVRGDLASTHPPLSPVAWTSLATGILPGKHRIFGFFDPRYTHVRAPRLGQTTRPVSAEGIGAPTLYQYLNHQGQTTGLLMVPVTHPPQPLQGYVVGDGILTPNEQSDYTYPSTLKEKVLAAVPKFRVRPYEYLRERLEFIDETTYFVEQQGRAACWLMENYPTDFTMVVFTATDVIQHYFWKYMDPTLSPYTTREGNEARPKLRRFYNLIDRLLADLVTQAGPRAVIILVSDHGFTSAKRVFYVNRWLYEQGLLSFDKSSEGRLRERLVKHGLTQERLFGLLKKLDILNLRQRLRGRDHLGAGIAVRKGIQDALAPKVDWTRTRAYAGNMGEPYVYINLEGRDPGGIVKPGKEYEQLCSLLCSKLAELHDPATGQCVVRKAYRAAELYPGPYAHEAPDIIVDFHDASLITSDSVQVSTTFQDDQTYRGVHDPNGILLLHGPGVQKGRQIENTRIIDVMPTVLHLLGAPLPEGLDGRVLTESLAEHFLSRNPVRYTTSIARAHMPESTGFDSYTDEESSEVEQRLRDLGYIT